MNNLLLSLLIELYLFHMGIAEKVAEPTGFTKRLLGNQSNGLCGARGHTGRIIISAHVTFNRRRAVRVGVEGAERTRVHTFIAGDADLLIQSDYAVNPA